MHAIRRVSTSLLVTVTDELITDAATASFNRALSQKKGRHRQKEFRYLVMFKTETVVSLGKQGASLFHYLLSYFGNGNGYVRRRYYNYPSFLVAIRILGAMIIMEVFLMKISHDVSLMEPHRNSERCVSFCS